jgi:propanediol dehydratase large subunit
MDGISVNNVAIPAKNVEANKPLTDKDIINYVIDKKIEENSLERTPQQDTFVAGSSVKSLAAVNVSTKDIATGIGTATAILVGLKQLAQAGFDVWDTFVERFGKPKTIEEEQVLRAILAPNVNKANNAA